MLYPLSRSSARFALLAAALALPLLIGCGGSSDMGKVSGKVTLDGAPLAGASLEFVPDNGRPSTGTTDASGAYTLQYSPTEVGAKVGKHKVRITSRTMREDPKTHKSEITPERLPAKYHANTELVREVKPGSNTIDFELTSR
ncbi:MAG: carboxypeptidase-like regulatory domain-containing protein [Gemmataceae bacterium]